MKEKRKPFILWILGQEIIREWQRTFTLCVKILIFCVKRNKGLNEERNIQTLGYPQAPLLVEEFRFLSSLLHQSFEAVLNPR